MTEAEARQWIADRFDVSRETQVARFVDIVMAESKHQNLIARSTRETIWHRHIVDSAQLLRLVADHDRGGRVWCDIGSGAGFPGIVIAVLSDFQVHLVEPRKRRAAFLDRVRSELNLDDRVTVHPHAIERFSSRKAVDIISARAVSNLSNLFEIAVHCAQPETRWLLPKGRSAQSEVEAARISWQGSFHVEQSITEPESRIVVAHGVSRQ